MDYEEPDVSSVRHHRARKPHTCCECRSVIRPGETYRLYSGCWDGEWSAFKTCRWCLEWIEWCVDDGHLFSELLVHLEETYGHPVVGSWRTAYFSGKWWGPDGTTAPTSEGK